MKQNLLVVCLFFLFFSVDAHSTHQDAGTDPILNIPTDFLDIDSNGPQIQVFPNPVINHFQISNNRVVTQIIVFDLLGKQVKKFDYRSGEKYFIGDLRKGIYLVQMLGEDKDILVTKRISKK